MELASDGDLATVLEIVHQFDEDSVALLHRLSDWVAGDAFPEVASAAHSLKGSAGVFGFSRVEYAAVQLELAALNEDRQNVGRWHSFIVDALPPAKEELTRYFAAL